MKEKISNRNVQNTAEEIYSGKNQTAATVLLETRRSGFSFPPLWSRIPVRILLSVIIISLFIGLGTVLYFKLASENTSKISTTTIVEQVQELATLATAEAVVTTVIKEEDNKLFEQKININLPGTKRIALIIVPAKVLAGVDLKSFTEKNVHIDEKKKEISLAIPHAAIIQEPSIQMDKVQTFSEEGVFRHEVNWSEGFDLASQANKKLKKEAIDMGLLTKADESAVKTLNHFFNILGYKTHVTFQ